MSFWVVELFTGYGGKWALVWLIALWFFLAWVFKWAYHYFWLDQE